MMSSKRRSSASGESGTGIGTGAAVPVGAGAATGVVKGVTKEPAEGAGCAGMGRG